MTTSTKESYAVLYPFGTDRSVALFDELFAAKDFLDDEANLTDMITELGVITICRLPQSREETEDDLLQQGDNEEYIMQVADLTEDVNQWQARSVWAEKLPNGELISLGACTDDDAPEPEQGGVVVEAWDVDGDPELYASPEEAAQNCNPSQYLINF